MPIYEYRCKDCGVVSEILQGVTIAEVPLKCSNCGGKNMVKLFSIHSGGNKKSSDRQNQSCCERDKKDFTGCVPESYRRQYYTLGE